jgi:hypothetical protein
MWHTRKLFRSQNFNLRMVRRDKPINNTDYVGLRYIIKNEDFGKFEAILVSDMMTMRTTWKALRK